MNFAHTAF